MKSIVRQPFAAVSVCLMLGTGTALADTAIGLYQGSPSVYGGAGIGVMAASDFCDDALASSCEDSAIAAKVFGGFRFHQNLAVEAAYVHLGELSAESYFMGPPVKVELEPSGVVVQALGIAPINDKAELFAKAGMMFWKLDVTGSSGGFSASESERGNDLVVGLGANIAVAERLSLRFDWDLYPNFGDEEKTGEDNLMTATVGLQFNF